jgi:hypothetical protein
LHSENRLQSDETLERYLAAIRRMENFFKGFTVEHIERAKNTEADLWAKAVARKMVLPLDVFFQTIKDPSVKTVKHQLWHTSGAITNPTIA